MQIEIGEYVRTKTGFISKFISKKKYVDIDEEVLDIYEFDKPIYYEYGEGYYHLYNEKDFDEVIAKHSKNIIDLVEVGDYVNGKLIHKIDKGKNYCYLYYGNCKTFVDYQIKSIVTKEQYKSVEYVM